MEAPQAFDASIFGMEDFDFQAAFESGLQDIVDDADLELGEQLSRIKTIITEAQSPFYEQFLDFGNLVSALQLACAHDHTLQQSMQDDPVLSNFLGTHAGGSDDGHGHGGVSRGGGHAEETGHKAGHKAGHKTGRGAERKKAKKTKKRRNGWLVYILTGNE